MTMQYNKPFQSIDQQLILLSQRGLVIDIDAAHYLKHLNYYRLSGYWLPFYEDSCTHQFKTNTQFPDVLNLYIFDRELRLLLLDAIERIEVSVKTQWAYYFSASHGAHAYMDCKLSNNIQWHAQNIILLEKELKRSDEVFISHYQQSLYFTVHAIDMAYL
jgi:abortive infection bacteriophage resistance protein